MKKIIAVVLSTCFLFCGCASPTTFGDVGDLSAEYVKDNTSIIEKGYDRIILFPDGRCFMHGFYSNNEYTSMDYYSYSKDTTYIVFYTDSDHVQSLAKLEGDKLIFEEIFGASSNEIMVNPK